MCVCVCVCVCIYESKYGLKSDSMKVAEKIIHIGDLIMM